MNKRSRKETSGHMIGGLFTFALFAMFVLLSLLIVVIGADGYRNVVEKSESLGEVRTSLGYVMGKLRSDAAADGAQLRTQAGVDTLVLLEVYEGEAYETIIFHRDGSLYELSKPAGYDFDPDNAWRLTDVHSFEMSQEGNLLRFVATGGDGRTQTVHAAVRTYQEVTGP